MSVFCQVISLINSTQPAKLSMKIRFLIAIITNLINICGFVFIGETNHKFFLFGEFWLEAILQL